MNSHLPIGIFDSGVGGLTVYRALHEHLPNERFVYLGDTARVPYGTKSLATVERYAVENAEFLAAHGIKMLAVRAGVSGPWQHAIFGCDPTFSSLTTEMRRQFLFD